MIRNFAARLRRLVREMKSGKSVLAHHGTANVPPPMSKYKTPVFLTNKPAPTAKLNVHTNEH
jgi:hypothetical protein